MGVPSCFGRPFSPGVVEVGGAENLWSQPAQWQGGRFICDGCAANCCAEHEEEMVWSTIPRVLQHDYASYFDNNRQNIVNDVFWYMLVAN